jgi:uncharacterized membrane protein YhiD involved in acid resistance
MPQELSLTNVLAPLDLTLLLFNLVVGLIMALILRVHFRRFGSTLSNREEFAQVFPFVMLTTVLIITVVKSSLALSLGLVGALSIVRFRTPIKEPEELAYLFVAIAIGLGLGANQTLPTVVASLFILTSMAFLSRNRKSDTGKNIYLSIDWNVKDDEQPDHYLEQLSELLAKHTININLRRFDVRDDSLEATFFLDVSSIDNLSTLSDELRQTFPSVGITFLDQNQLPSV